MVQNMTGAQFTARVNRIKEFLDYGNLDGAQAFLGFLIEDTERVHLDPQTWIDAWNEENPDNPRKS